MSLVSLIERHDGTALVYDDQPISYAQLRSATATLAHTLHARGVRAGDVVSVMLPNSPAFVATYFACWTLGAVANPLNTRLSTGELAGIVQHAGSRALVVGPDSMANGSLAELVHRAAPEPGAELLVTHVLETLTLPTPDASAALTPAAAGPHDPAVLIYTSGTTAVPKGVRLSHGNLVADATGIADRLGVDSSYRTLCFMPLFHCNALIFSHLSTFVSGGSVVLVPKFSATHLLDDIERHGAHSFSCPPTVLAMLLERMGPHQQAPSSLAFVKVGAAPLTEELARTFEARLGVGLVEGYGMTEGTATSVMHDPRVGRPAGTVGIPLPGQAIRIVDEAGTELPAGHVGEIQISGTTVMLGYHRDPEQSAAAMDGPWLRTGDLGSLDVDGYLRLCGRKKELIIRGGENIHPVSLDQVLEEHPSVVEGAAYGVPDLIWGESPAAAVVVRPGYDPQVLADFMRERVADFAQPVAYRVVDRIPRNAVGKIQRHRLRELHLAEPASAPAPEEPAAAGIESHHTPIVERNHR